jgi:hypothetical protein
MLCFKRSRFPQILVILALLPHEMSEGAAINLAQVVISTFREFSNVAVSWDGFMDKIKPDGQSDCLE